jgi:hypothetical protein
MKSHYVYVVDCPTDGYVEPAIPYDFYIEDGHVKVKCERVNVFFAIPIEDFVTIANKVEPQK